jgi:hypothetical protein
VRVRSQYLQQRSGLHRHPEGRVAAFHELQQPEDDQSMAEEKEDSMLRVSS